MWVTVAQLARSSAPISARTKGIALREPACASLVTWVWIVPSPGAAMDMEPATIRASVSVIRDGMVMTAPSNSCAQTQAVQGMVLAKMESATARMAFQELPAQ